MEPLLEASPVLCCAVRTRKRGDGIECADACLGRPGAKLAFLAFGAGFGSGAAYQESSKEVRQVDWESRG